MNVIFVWYYCQSSPNLNLSLPLELLAIIIILTLNYLIDTYQMLDINEKMAFDCEFILLFNLHEQHIIHSFCRLNAPWLTDNIRLLFKLRQQVQKQVYLHYFIFGTLCCSQPYSQSRNTTQIDLLEVSSVSSTTCDEIRKIGNLSRRYLGGFHHRK